MSCKGKKVVDIINCFAVVSDQDGGSVNPLWVAVVLGVIGGWDCSTLSSNELQALPKPKLQANPPNCLTTSNIKAEMYARTFGDLGGGGLQNPFRVRSAGVYKYILSPPQI